jgi:hypothetical protein
MNNFDQRITDRIRGPAWAAIRDRVVQLCDTVLGVAPNTRAELTTIYVKFSVADEPTAPVYAVAWLKTAKNVVIGFALPEAVNDPSLTVAPTGMTYKGITKYWRLSPEEALSADISNWARTSFEAVNARRNPDGD